MSIRSMASDFRNGLSVIFGKPKEGEGDRKLAKMADLVMAQIPVYGKDSVRKQIIKSIENDLKRTYKKKGKDGVEEQIRIALGTPEYALLLSRVGLTESHIRIMAMEVRVMAMKVRKK